MSKNRKCWKVGTDDLGYLLYWTHSRGRARQLGASDMCGPYSLHSFDDAMALRAMRVSDLDDLEVEDAPYDARLNLLAGMYQECVGCHREVSLSAVDDRPQPWFELGAVVTGPYCEVCVQDVSGADEMDYHNLLRHVRSVYGSAVSV